MPISAENDRYNLRAGEHIRIFRQTRKGWKALKALNGVPSGDTVLALRHRQAAQREGASLNCWEKQFAYDKVVSQVFFHRSLQGYVDQYGLPPAHASQSRLRRPGNGWLSARILIIVNAMPPRAGHHPSRHHPVGEIALLIHLQHRHVDVTTADQTKRHGTVEHRRPWLESVGSASGIHGTGLCFTLQGVQPDKSVF
jgi:hypothetical protein